MDSGFGSGIHKVSENASSADTPMSASRGRQGQRCASRMLRATSFIAPGIPPESK